MYNLGLTPNWSYPKLEFYKGIITIFLSFLGGLIAIYLKRRKAKKSMGEKERGRFVSEGIKKGRLL